MDNEYYTKCNKIVLQEIIDYKNENISYNKFEFDPHAMDIDYVYDINNHVIGQSFASPSNIDIFFI